MTAILLASTAPYTVDQVMSPYVYVFYAAYIVAFIFTPVMRSIAIHFGIIDQPDLARKMHTRPVAYLGGMAVFLGWMAGLAESHFAKLHALMPAGVADHVVIKPSIVPAAVIVVILGFWDDVRRIAPWIKIAGQIGAAVALLVSGIGVHSLDPVLWPISHHLEAFNFRGLPAAFMAVCGSIFTVALVVFCCNATNLMDGLDGLCGGVTAIIVGGFLFLALHLGALSAPGDAPEVALRIVLAMALLGAVLGFIPYNFNPASIFMGDTGSMFLGFCCALLILLMSEVDGRWLLGSLIMFALPVLDTSLAFARRWVNRRPFFSPDRHHFHHQLVARGLTVRKTVIISYALALGFAVLGGAIVYLRTRYAGMIYFVVFGSIVVTAYKMGMVHEKPAAIVTAKPMGSSTATLSTADIEPTTVLEVRGSAPAQSAS